MHHLKARVKPLTRKWLPLFALSLIILPTNSCSNSCASIQLEVENLEEQADLEFEKARQKDFSYTYKQNGVTYDYMRGERYYYEEKMKSYKIAARIVVNNPKCFDPLKVAESQELIA